MSEQLGAAHRDELRRVADSHTYHSPDRPRAARDRNRVFDPRRRLGTFLIRMGTRMTGAESSALVACPPGVVC